MPQRVRVQGVRMIERIQHQVTETCDRDQALRILQWMLSTWPFALEAEDLRVVIEPASPAGMLRLGDTQEQPTRVAVSLRFSYTALGPARAAAR